MRLRIAMCTVAAIGLLFTFGVGAGFAQGLDGSDSAGQQQYGSPSNDADVLGEIGEVREEPEPAPAPQAAPAPQPVQQSGQLPFTGFATLAVVLLGAALLGGGLMLRRSTREQS